MIKLVHNIVLVLLGEICCKHLLLIA